MVGRRVQINPIAYERQFHPESFQKPNKSPNLREGELQPKDMSEHHPGGVPFVRNKKMDPTKTSAPQPILRVKKDPYVKRRPQALAFGFTPPKPVVKPDPMNDPFLKPAYRTYMKKMIAVAPSIQLPPGFAVAERNALFKEYLERRGRHLLHDYRTTFEPEPPQRKILTPHKRFW